MGIKISDLPVASQSNTDDIFPVVQDNTTKQIQQSVLLQDVNNDITDLNNDIDRLDNRIDEAIAEFTYPLSYKGEVQTIADLPSGATAGDIYTVISENKNYIWNGTEWVEYAAAIDFTNIENQIKTTLTTEQAEEHTIQNTAPVNGKIDVSGNSTQETNLSDGILEQGSIYHAEEVESTARVRTKNFTKVVSGSNIVVKADGNFEYMLALYSSSKTYIDNTNSWISVGNSITISSNVGYIRVILKKSDGSDFTPSEIINFNIGPTPSPDYPSEIHNVGDNVNLFDKTVTPVSLGSMNASQTILETGIKLISTTTSSSQVIGSKVYKSINLTNYVGKTITMKASFSKSNSSLKPNYSLILCDSNGGNRTTKISSSTSNKPISFVVPELDGTSIYLGIQLFITNGSPITSGDYVEFTDLKIEFGETATTYSPHNCGNANIEVSNKNLFDKNETPSYTNTTALSVLDTGIKATLTATGTYKFGIIPIPNSEKLLGKQITISGNIAPSISNDNNMGRIALYGLDSNGQITGSGLLTLAGIGSKTGSVTLPNEFPSGVVEYGLLFYSNHSSSNATTNAYVNYTEVQLEKNSTATDYIEHQSQLITFPFTEGQRMYLGDYLASDGIHHKRSTTSLKDLSWRYDAEGNRFLCNNVSSLNIKGAISDNEPSEQILSNIFKVYSNNNIGTSNFHNDGIAITTTGLIRVKYEETTDVSTFVTMLTNKNAILEYELATEVVEPYTEEQEEAYWQLQHCLMYEGYTKVECIDETKCKTIVEYYYNNELNATYAGRIDGIDEEIHNIVDKFYPVGSIYMSVNSLNPSTLFGGTWERWGNGRVAIGVDTTDTDFNEVEKTGGNKTHTHTNSNTGSTTLTVNQIPAHNHTIKDSEENSNIVAGRYNTGTPGGYAFGNGGTIQLYTKGNIELTTINAGGGQGHTHTVSNTGSSSNVQPYITCYMWKRTA